MRVISMSEVGTGNALSPEEEARVDYIRQVAQDYSDKINHTKITISVVDAPHAVCRKFGANAHIHVNNHSAKLGTICIQRVVLQLVGEHIEWLMAHEVAHLAEGRHGNKHTNWTDWLLGLSPSQGERVCNDYHRKISKLRCPGKEPVSLGW